MGKGRTDLTEETAGALRVSQAEMDAQIARHEAVLTTLIKDSGGSPADGAILTIIKTIDALRRLPTQG